MCLGQSLEESFEYSAYVFVGEFKEQVDYGKSQYHGFVFDVKHSWKLPAPQSIEIAYFPPTGWNCSFTTFSKGKKYLIFVDSAKANFDLPLNYLIGDCQNAPPWPFKPSYLESKTKLEPFEIVNEWNMEVFDQSASKKEITAEVTDVISGDMISVSIDGKNILVRYLGIMAPQYGGSGGSHEIRHKSPLERNEELVGGKTVRLVFDEKTRKENAPLEAYVFSGDDLAVNVNYTLLAEGYATVRKWPSNTNIDWIMLGLSTSLNHQKGIWGIPKGFLATDGLIGADAYNSIVHSSAAILIAELERQNKILSNDKPKKKDAFAHFFKSRNILINAVGAFGFETKEVILPLLRTMNLNDSGSANGALISLGPDIAPDLVSALKNGEPDIQLAAIGIIKIACDRGFWSRNIAEILTRPNKAPFDDFFEAFKASGVIPVLKTLKEGKNKKASQAAAFALTELDKSLQETR